MMADVIRLLNTVGKTNFVTFYGDYEIFYKRKDRVTREEKLKFAQKLLRENVNATKESGQIARINAALTIFTNGLEHDALKLVLESKHPCITKEVKQQALDLLHKERVG
ncbi:hypothetical protein [Priestia koreensis]|uniref:hypothetical protein n=1 Tax=Priestia koreensis TaxID=284581 RepID=UPI002041F6EB|nr:hypothetical protein [Priestia koreensis]MCM3005791.1 hypothetical protein [Priestia koreensis]